jgi:large subunit ribosomal protein L25
MAETVVLVGEKREGRGTRGARRLRAGGRVPGVLYGHKEATVPVSLDGETLTAAIRHGTRVVELKLDGAGQQALIREVQWDHLGKDLLHVDFLRVSRDERIHVTVPVEIRGIAPGVTAGGVLDQPLHTLHVECLAIAVPDSIRVNVSELQIGSAIHVRELHLPEGVTVLDDPESVVLIVKTPQAAPEAAPAAPEAGAAEPEVIGRKATEEEEEKG